MSDPAPSAAVDSPRAIFLHRIPRSGEWVWYDETVKGTVEYVQHSLPTLYIDDYTVIEEVRDLRELRHGDHCLVGLNPIRKVFGWLDTTVMHMGSWEVLRFFHHFVMYDDVHHISALDRVPCTSGGDPARICEFSNTPQQAWTQMMSHGWSHLWEQPATFHRIPLHDYTQAASCGVFRVRRSLSGLERRRILSHCLELMEGHKRYDLFVHNCESAAFRLCYETEEGRHEVSPQVPWALWSCLRVTLSLVGVVCLLNMPQKCDSEIVGRDAPINENTIVDLGDKIAVDNQTPTGCFWGVLLHFTYHLFATAPIVLQSVFQLVRVTVHLTEQRAALGLVTYYHLLAKEVGRAVFVGGAAACIVAVMPQVVSETRLYGVACALTLTTRFVLSMVYRFVAQCIIRLTRKNLALGGVPVMVFKAVRGLPTSQEALASPELDRARRGSPSRHDDVQDERPEVEVLLSERAECSQKPQQGTTTEQSWAETAHVTHITPARNKRTPRKLSHNSTCASYSSPRDRQPITMNEAVMTRSRRRKLGLQLPDDNPTLNPLR